MASLWDNIAVKCGNVTNEQKNSTIYEAVTTWTLMGLSDEQIAFGIATMGVESGFNPYAKGPSETEYGLGQMNDATWNRAVAEYNNNYGGTLDPEASRSDASAQITAIGAWIEKVWGMAESVANDPRLAGYSLEQIAYGMWHEGFGTQGNVAGVSEFLKDSNGFNNATIGGYFTLTYLKAGANLGVISPHIGIWSLQDIKLSEVINRVRSIFTAGENVGLVSASPIILDLDKDGVETTALTSGTYFDHDANGFAEKTGWVDSGDGLLAIDRNNDGQINNGSELFGDNTLLANGTKADNGFQALAELDSNTDGKIDSTDTAYNQLKVWQDIDEDGYTSEGELHSFRLLFSV